MIYLQYKIYPIYLHHQTTRNRKETPYETLRQATHHEESLAHLPPLVRHHILRSPEGGMEKGEGRSRHAGEAGKPPNGTHRLRQTQRAAVRQCPLRKERLGVSLRKEILTKQYCIMDYGKDYGKKGFAAPCAGIGAYSRENGQRAVPCGKVFTGRCAGAVRVAGRSEGVPLGGVFRTHVRKPARAGDGVHTGNAAGRRKLTPKPWHIHVISGTLTAALVTLSFFPGTVSPVILMPLGVLACWCLFVSGVRIIQEVTGCRDLNELIEEVKKED